LARARAVSSALHGLFRERRKNMAAIAHKLWTVKREGLYEALGYTSMSAYGWSEHGLGATQVSELTGISKASEGLPKTREAFDAGHLHWTKAREITKAATPETEGEWLEKSQTTSANQLRAERKGEAPKIHRGFSLSPEQAARFDQLVAGLRKEVGVVAGADAMLELMTRGASGARGEAPVQRVVITECGSCGDATSPSRDGPVPVSQAAVEHARCSGEVHDLRAEENVVKRAVPAAVRRRVNDRDGGCCLVPGCGAMSALDVHHEDGWKAGHDPVRMLTLCWWHHRLRHEGSLAIEGSAPNFRFVLADGMALRERPNFSREKFAASASPATSRAQADATLALRGLEVKTREAKQWVEVALASEPGRAWSTEDLVRAALLLNAG
jgi:hypothetical protein